MRFLKRTLLISVYYGKLTVQFILNEMFSVGRINFRLFFVNKLMFMVFGMHFSMYCSSKKFPIKDQFLTQKLPLFWLNLVF